MTERKRARELANEAIAAGEPLAWFERLYREAESENAVVPWADLRPNPHVVAWLDAASREVRGRALVVGCGFGDDAEELSRRGLEVTAFDVAPSAVERARLRFAGSRVLYTAANLLDPPREWLGAFDFVVEVYTLQVLPPSLRLDAARMLVRLLAPGGVLLVVARGREESEHPGSMPWLLTRAEVEAMAEIGVEAADGASGGGGAGGAGRAGGAGGAGGAHLVSFEDFADDEVPPVRRFRAVFVRAAVGER